MPIPVHRNKPLRCPNCGSEDLAKHPRVGAEHLMLCEVCHKRWDADEVRRLNNESSNEL